MLTGTRVTDMQGLQVTLKTGRGDLPATFVASGSEIGAGWVRVTPSLKAGDAVVADVVTDRGEPGELRLVGRVEAASSPLRGSKVRLEVVAAKRSEKMLQRFAEQVLGVSADEVGAYDDGSEYPFVLRLDGRGRPGGPGGGAGARQRGGAARWARRLRSRDGNLDEARARDRQSRAHEAPRTISAIMRAAAEPRDLRGDPGGGAVMSPNPADPHRAAADSKPADAASRDGLRKAARPDGMRAPAASATQPLKRSLGRRVGAVTIAPEDVGRGQGGTRVAGGAAPPSRPNGRPHLLRPAGRDAGAVRQSGGRVGATSAEADRLGLSPGGVADRAGPERQRDRGRWSEVPSASRARAAPAEDPRGRPARPSSSSSDDSQGTLRGRGFAEPPAGPERSARGPGGGEPIKGVVPEGSRGAGRSSLRDTSDARLRALGRARPEPAAPLPLAPAEQPLFADTTPGSPVPRPRRGAHGAPRRPETRQGPQAPSPRPLSGLTAERRAERRVLIDLAVTYYLGAEPAVGRAVSVSQTALCIVADDTLPDEGAAMSVRLPVLQGGKHQVLMLTGSVLRSVRATGSFVVTIETVDELGAPGVFQHLLSGGAS